MRKYAIISMDVEEWYHTYYSDLDVNQSISMLDGLDIILSILEKEKIKGSFFIVGEIADKISDKIKIMDKNGHDIGIHNNIHKRPITMSLNEFQIQLIKAKKKVEEILGHQVNGYRAPSFGIDDDRLDIVKNCNFLYDSSKIKMQKSSKYSFLNLNGYEEVRPCIYKKDNFLEFEVSTQKIGPMNMLLGGGYLRMLPWFFMKKMINEYLKSGKPYVMYIHPIDLSKKVLPKVEGNSFDSYLRTHIGRKHMINKFIKTINLLKKNGYNFVTFEQLRKMEIE